MYHKRKNYEIYLLARNSSDQRAGLYLIGLALTDAKVQNNYVEIDLSWREGLSCYVLSFMCMLAVLISTFVMLGISIERYSFIKYPLSGRHSMKIEAVIPITLAILVSTVLYIRHQVEGLSYLSSPLRIFLGKSENSVTQKIVTVVISLYLFLSLFIILILNYTHHFE